MKKILLSIVLGVASIMVSAQVGVGTTDPKAALEVKSSTSGFLMPRMTTTERQAIKKADGTPLDAEEIGMQVFDTTTGSVWIYTGGITWVNGSTLADDAVTASKININVAGTGLKQNATTGALEIDPTTITADGTITSTGITVTGGTNAALNDVTLEIAADAVTTAKILNANITTAKIAPGSNNQHLVTDATGAVKWIDAKDTYLGDKTIHHDTATGTALAITEALHHNADIHLEGTDDLTIDSTAVSDATNFYITNTTAVDRILTFTGGFTTTGGAFLRNGGAITNVASGGLTLKSNTRYLCHITENTTGQFFFNATEAGAGGGGNIKIWAQTNAYVSGDLVIKDDKIFQANGTIAANTVFSIGTMGATWKEISKALTTWVNATNGSSTYYATNDLVSYNGIIYRNRTGTNTDTNPTLDILNWESVQGGSFSFLRIHRGEDTIQNSNGIVTLSSTNTIVRLTRGVNWSFSSNTIPFNATDIVNNDTNFTVTQNTITFNKKGTVKLNFNIGIAMDDSSQYDTAVGYIVKNGIVETSVTTNINDPSNYGGADLVLSNLPIDVEVGDVIRFYVSGSFSTYYLKGIELTASYATVFEQFVDTTTLIPINSNIADGELIIKENGELVGSTINTSEISVLRGVGVLDGIARAVGAHLRFDTIEYPVPPNPQPTNITLDTTTAYSTTGQSIGVITLKGGSRYEVMGEIAIEGVSNTYSSFVWKDVDTGAELSNVATRETGSGNIGATGGMVALAILEPTADQRIKLVLKNTVASGTLGDNDAWGESHFLVKEMVGHRVYQIDPTQVALDPNYNDGELVSWNSTTNLFEGTNINPSTNNFIFARPENQSLAVGQYISFVQDPTSNGGGSITSTGSNGWTLRAGNTYKLSAGFQIFSDSSATSHSQYSWFRKDTDAEISTMARILEGTSYNQYMDNPIVVGYFTPTVDTVVGVKSTVETSNLSIQSPDYGGFFEIQQLNSSITVADPLTIPVDLTGVTNGDTFIWDNGTFKKGTITLSPNKFQTKWVTASFPIPSVEGEITALRFNNLVVGKTYKYYGAVHFQGTGDDFGFYIKHNGVKHKKIYNYVQNLVSEAGKQDMEHTFVAEASTVEVWWQHFNVSLDQIIGSTTTGGATYGASNMTLEECNNLIEVTDFN